MWQIYVFGHTKVLVSRINVFQWKINTRQFTKCTKEYLFSSNRLYVCILVFSFFENIFLKKPYEIGGLLTWIKFKKKLFYNYLAKFLVFIIAPKSCFYDQLRPDYKWKCFCEALGKIYSRGPPKMAYVRVANQ